MLIAVHHKQQYKRVFHEVTCKHITELYKLSLHLLAYKQFESFCILCYFLCKCVFKLIALHACHTLQVSSFFIALQNSPDNHILCVLANCHTNNAESHAIIVSCQFPFNKLRNPTIVCFCANCLTKNQKIVIVYKQYKS